MIANIRDNLRAQFDRILLRGKEAYVSALTCAEDCAYCSNFSILSCASSAGSLKGSSILLRREEFIQMIVTSKAENTIQAATIEIIMTVMAYSLIFIEQQTYDSRMQSSHCAKLSNQEVYSLGSPAIMQFVNCLDP